MKNSEIILNAAISNEIITLTDAEKLIQKYGDLPIHTYQHWKEIGYQVRKGERAAFKALLWKLAKGKKQAEDPADDGEQTETKETKRKMIMTRAALFTWEQVDKIDTETDPGQAPDPAPAPEKKKAPAKKKAAPAKSKKLETKTLTKEEREENLKKIIDTPVIIVPKKEKEQTVKETLTVPKLKKALTINDCTGDNAHLNFTWDHGTLKGQWNLFMTDYFPMGQRNFKIILNDILTAPNKDQVLEQVTNYLCATKLYNSDNYNKTKKKMLDANIKQIAAIA